MLRGGPKYDEVGRRIDRQKKVVSDSSSDEVQRLRWHGWRQKGIDIGKMKLYPLVIKYDNGNLTIYQ